MAKWMDDTIIYTTEVSIGDIISSPMFENLLFRDIMEMNPIRGCFVNPRIPIKSVMNETYTRIESLGVIMRRVGADKRRVSYKMVIDPKSVFVVVHIEDDCEQVMEQNGPDGIEGHYPTLVKARMLGPMSIWDPNGLEITFRMNTVRAKYAVNQVVLDGHLFITYNIIANAKKDLL